MWHLEKLGLGNNHLSRIATRILELCGDDPAKSLILLPSSRACASLRHKLLDSSDKQALLLPQILTPALFCDDLAQKLDLETGTRLPETLRHSALSLGLSESNWFNDEHGAIPGIADQLVNLFDELRLSGIDPARLSEYDQESELFQADARKVMVAWEVHQQRIGIDRIANILEVNGRLTALSTWPASPLEHLVLAGFADLQPVIVNILNHVTRLSGARAHLFSFALEADDEISSLFLASYDTIDEIHPQYPAQRVCSALEIFRPILPKPDMDERSYPERIDDLDPDALLEPPDYELMPCSDPESESREIAARVVEFLQDNPARRVAVATANRALATRVAAQLRDAGLDLDDTGGTSLSTEPEGVLAWFLLRAATSKPTREDLLEIITHPLTTFGNTRSNHRLRALRFERELLRGEMIESSLAGYRTRAAVRDTELRKSIPGAPPSLTELVEDLQAALSPLLEIQRKGQAKADRYVSALGQALTLTAPVLDTTESSNVSGYTSAGWNALQHLLEQVEAASPYLPSLTPQEYLSLMGDLMSRCTVRLNRSVHLPVQITGLLEARLEYFDLLIIGGLNDEVFPGSLPRPLFLGQHWRRKTGLSDWRRHLGLQAELFLRLLHNAPHVVLSWSREKSGQPLLPSSYLERLMLGMRTRPRFGPNSPLYRHNPPLEAGIKTAQNLFRDETPSRPSPEQIQPLGSLSHTSIKNYMDCPYRFLLTRGFGLFEEDQLQQEVGNREYGEIIHQIMYDFLDPDGAGVAAMLKNDITGAEHILHDLTGSIFDRKAGDFPQRHLYQAGFLASAPRITTFETARLQEWRPAAREIRFSYSLTDLHCWLDDASLPAPTPDTAGIKIEGTLDRLDIARNDSGRFCVIDYKTGRIPSERDVREGGLLQLPIYALAVFCKAISEIATTDPTLASGAYYGFGPENTGINKLQMGSKVDLESLGRQIYSTITEMAESGIQYPLAPEVNEGPLEKLACRWCDFRGLCRVDEKIRIPRPTDPEAI